MAGWRFGVPLSLIGPDPLIRTTTLSEMGTFGSFNNGTELMIRSFASVLFTLLALSVAAYAVLFLSQTIDPNNPFHVKFSWLGVVVPLHFFCGALALALSPLQLSQLVRRRVPQLHRIAGLTYIACILLGGTAGLVMAVQSEGGTIARWGFAGMAITWIATTLIGLSHILRRDISKHRMWMVRSVAVTSSAISLRLILGLGVPVLGLPFMAVYQFAAWGSWVINLLLVELWLRKFFSRRSALARSPA